MPNKRIYQYVTVVIMLASIILIVPIVKSEPPIEIIYWQPSDIQTPDQQEIDSLIGIIEDVQYFLSSEMDIHGFGKKSFNFNPEVSVIKANQPLNSYTDALTIANESKLIEYGFDNAIYVVFIGGATSFGSGGIAVSQGLCANIPENLKYCNNLVVIPANQKALISVLTAHEIGHAFGLDHPQTRLVQGKIDIMYFPLHVIPDRIEDLKDYTLNVDHAKQLNAQGRLFIQDEIFDIDEQNLISYYTFDNNVEDVTPYANHGTPYKSLRKVSDRATYVQGKFGKAVSFENGSHVVIDASESLHGNFFRSDTWTIMLWFYAKKSTGYGHAWRSGVYHGTGLETLFIIEDTGTISWRGIIGGKWSYNSLCETPTGVFKSDTWVHVAVTSDGSKLRIYVDGQKQAETDFQRTDGGNLIYHIGSYVESDKPGSENFTGYIDDLAIFSRTLQKHEINRVMTEGVAEFLKIDESEISYDLNNDGKINIFDLILVAQSIDGEYNKNTDLNGDGEINILDLRLIALNFD